MIVLKSNAVIEIDDLKNSYFSASFDFLRNFNFIYLKDD